ncbi:MAG: hypothetical protein U9N73_03530 [Candidatus Auribacterota bacterium]|nr:hypothetical protein [Candidatus Auribacterota bacterium]
MKVGIWGAGSVGFGITYRFATLPFVSQIFWINRTFKKIIQRVVDIEHGLAFAPTCRSIDAYDQDSARRVLPDIDLLILALGASVPPGKSRADVYLQNRKIYRDAVLLMLDEEFHGIVLVVTNPVDLITRLIQRESKLTSSRILGLGTVVETARLRASLGSYLSPRRPARDIWAYAIGTHDENFVPVAVPELTVGGGIDPQDFPEILECARREVVRAANRVKADEKSTLHPIVEGVVRIAEAIALDDESILTPSVLDPETIEGLCYSIPCTISQDGLIWRYSDILDKSIIRKAIDICCDSLRDTLKRAGEL